MFHFILPPTQSLITKTPIIAKQNHCFSDTFMESFDFPENSNICVVGAGAIGGLLGVHLSRAGHNVTFVARGQHLAAMQDRQALSVIKPDGETIHSASGSQFVSNVCQCAKPQHVFILGLKMHQIVDVLDDLNHVLTPQSLILTTQNGIPWWYFQIYNGPAQYRGRAIESVDPGGILKNAIDPSRLLSTVVYPAAYIEKPGVIRHVEGTRFPLGELNGECTPRAQWMSNALVTAGFKSPVLDDVRAEQWLKLWGTVAVNPLSALTHATLDILCAHDSPGRDVVVRIMREVEAVAAALGSKMRVPIERRVDGAAKVGRHRTSMLQDVESGREMEIETIVGAVVELADLCHVDVPCVRTIYGTIRLLAQVMRDERVKICPVPTGN